MFAPCAKTPADTTRLRSIGRVDEHHPQPGGFGLVRDKGIQLCPRPTVQACPYPLPGLETSADVAEVFQHDYTGTAVDCFLHDGFRDDMVGVTDTPPFLAGESLQMLSSRLRPVGLETTTQGKISVVDIAEVSPTVQRACRGSSQDIFSTIHAQWGRAGRQGNIRKV